MKFNPDTIVKFGPYQASLKTLIMAWLKVDELHMYTEARVPVTEDQIRENERIFKALGRKQRDLSNLEIVDPTKCAEIGNVDVPMSHPAIVACRAALADEIRAEIAALEAQL